LPVHSLQALPVRRVPTADPEALLLAPAALLAALAEQAEGKSVGPSKKKPATKKPSKKAAHPSNPNIKPIRVEFRVPCKTVLLVN